MAAALTNIFVSVSPLAGASGPDVSPDTWSFPVVSHGIIALSLVTLAGGIFYLLLKRKDYPRRRATLFFGLFVLFCGLRLFVEILALHLPTQGLLTVLNGLAMGTGLISMVLFLRKLPMLVKMPNMSQLLEAGQELQEQRQRNLALSAEIQELHATIAAHLEEKTADLQDINERYALLARLAPMMIWTVNDTHIVYANEHFQEYLGIDGNDTIEASLQTIHPDDRQRMFENWQESIHKGHGHDIEVRMREKATGQHRWHRYKMSPSMTSAQGEKFRIGLAVDIHDSRIQRAELEQSLEQQRELGRRAAAAQQQYNILTETLPMMVWMLQGDEVIFSNGAYEQFVRDENGAVQAISSLAHPDDYDSLRAAREESLMANTQMDVVARLRPAAGSEYAHFRLIAVRTYPDTHGGNANIWTLLAINVEKETSRELERDQALRELKNMADSVPQQLWVGAADGTLIFANNELRDFVGMPPNSDPADIQRVGNGYIHPEDIDMVMKHWQRSAETGEDYEVQFRMRSAVTGEYRILLGKATPYRNRNGEIEKWYGSNTDLTELNRLQEISSAQSREFVSMADSVPLHLWVCDNEQNMLFANARVAQAIGSLSDDPHLNSQRYFECFHPDDALKLEKIYSAAKEQGIPFQTDARFCPAGSDGYLTLLISMHPQKDEKGNIARWYGSATDISQIQQLQNELRLKEEDISALADRIPHLVWGTDASGQLIYVNQQFLDYIGVAREDVYYNDLWAEFVHPEDRAFTFAAWSHSLDSGEKYEVEYRYRNKEGQYRWKLVRGTPIYDNEGQISRWFGTITDIEDKKQMEQLLLDTRLVLEQHVQDRTAELQRSNQALMASNQELEQFAYVASHDLKEPLRMITIYTQMLAKGIDFDKHKDLKEYVDFTIDGVKRMTELITDLLKYARVTRSVPDFERINLSDVLLLAQRHLKLKAEETGAIIHVPEQMPDVQGVQSLLVQLFQNLLDNAMKFMAPGSTPEIQVRARTEGDMVICTVEDNGIGISMEFKERVFVIFQRLHTREQYPGTGIGLSVCKKIVNLHGGEIWVESTPGEGTAFHFTLRAY